NPSGGIKNVRPANISRFSSTEILCALRVEGCRPQSTRSQCVAAPGSYRRLYAATWQGKLAATRAKLSHYARPARFFVKIGMAAGFDGGGVPSNVFAPQSH